MNPEQQKKEDETRRRASREMRIAIFTITLACIGVCVAVALVVLIGHIKLF